LLYSLFSVANTLGAALATLVSGGGAAHYVAALAYSNQMNWSAQSLLRAKTRFLEDLRQMKQLELTLQNEENKNITSTESAENLLNHDISLQGVNFALGKNKILHDIDLDIPAGSIVTLNGVSGAGKSTLLKLLSGYYKPTDGTVNLGGVDMKSLRKKGKGNMYDLFSYVPQFPYIEETSVRDNLLFGLDGKKVSDEVLNTVLESVNLTDRFADLDEVLKPGRGDAGTLSGGEASRLGLARAMLRAQVKGSKIIFLDEPTASVDEPTAKVIADLINNAKKTMPGTTFVIISHDQDFLSQIKTDQSVEMKKGRIMS
jgi:ATP-binding cassette subfamily B protein IrtA